MYVVRLRHFPNGGRLGFPPALASMAWKESKLAQKIPLQAFWDIQKEVMKEDHSKVICYCNGVPVGGLLLFPGVDAHVGPCLLAFHQYLMPGSRGVPRLWASAIKQAKQAARDRGLKFLVLTHQEPGTSRIIYTYKEV